ncbi:MAG: polysaccharide deacetylase family protein [Thermomicrobium sp.]|uniref:polysaccharide deacetylase family protein n=1 Tax=Thermomicrobium sp. TaxID=1969469 RepID=UPI001B1D93FD|nr:polysaccharide deacetylase family protein [Thermomicrobium sp.]MBO9357971.1 polysaccharide deacetylase family protein [Thermomicrobium sp.]
METTEAVIALALDCGADRGYTGEILDELARHGIRATFGMTGAWARANPDLVARMLHAGHRLINHSETHPSFTGRSTGSPSLSVDQRAAEIRRAEQAVAAVSGSETTMRPYFRPPYGDYDEALLTLLPELGYSVIVMWTVDSLGWRGIPPEEVVTRVLAAAQPGAIVLLHVGAQSTAAAALPQLIASLQERGYGFVTIDTQPG